MNPLSSHPMLQAHRRRLSALAFLAAFAMTPAQAKPHAAVACADSVAITGHLAYAGACQDPVQGNVTATLVATFGGFDYALYGDTKGKDGPFDNAPHGESAGTLNLAQTLYGRFVLGLKARNAYSLYLFDGGDAGVDGIDFDTLGVSRGDDAKLTHAFVFTPGGTLPTAPTVIEPGTGPKAVAPTVAGVPEPASTVLVLAALAAVGLTARRRR